MNILVFHARPLLRLGLAEIIRSHSRPIQVLEAGRIEELRSLLGRDAAIDVVLLDLNTLGELWEETTHQFRETCPDLRILLIAEEIDRRLALRIRNSGAVGCLSLSSPIHKLQRGTERIMDGYRCFLYTEQGVDSNGSDSIHRARINALSGKELAVLQQLNKGLNNQQIGHQLSSSVYTVKGHISRLLKKLQLSSRTQAVLYYRQYQHIFQRRSGLQLA